MQDILIRGGTVIDGTGAPRYRADVAVKDGRITAIGDLKDMEAKKVLDASGLVVAPGFFDALPVWWLPPAFSTHTPTRTPPFCGIPPAPPSCFRA